MEKLRLKFHNRRRLCSSGELERARTEKLLERDQTRTLRLGEVRLADIILLVHISLIYIFTILTVFISSTFAYTLIIITLLWIPTVVIYLQTRQEEEMRKIGI